MLYKNLINFVYPEKNNNKIGQQHNTHLSEPKTINKSEIKILQNGFPCTGNTLNTEKSTLSRIASDHSIDKVDLSDSSDSFVEHKKCQLTGTEFKSKINSQEKNKSSHSTDLLLSLDKNKENVSNKNLINKSSPPPTCKKFDSRLATSYSNNNYDKVHQNLLRTENYLASSCENQNQEKQKSEENFEKTLRQSISSVIPWIHTGHRNCFGIWKNNN